MFISKLVCDKCGTPADTTDNFCRSCGANGKREDDSIKLSDLITKTSRCKSCGKLVEKYGWHQCEGLMPKKFYDDTFRHGTVTTIAATNGLQTKLL